MRMIAIITARGGSKRIPKKNIKNFCGKPIIAYSIEAALQSGCFDNVMVSTDSKEIKAVAEEYGASVPFMRSDITSNDFATTADVIEEVVTEYKIAGKQFNSYCCIYPTAPFITSERLKEASKCFFDLDVEALVAVARYNFPPQRAFLADEGLVRYQFPEYERIRSQDLKPIYHDCGQFYFGNIEKFLKYHTLIMPRTASFLVPEIEMQDIDTEMDWKLAEMKYKMTTS